MAQNQKSYDNEFKAELAKIKEERLANFAIKKALENISVTDEEVKKDDKDDFFNSNKPFCIFSIINAICSFSYIVILVTLRISPV